ncbi:hypothetical protein YC2023_054352 [Brassica napus]
MEGRIQALVSMILIVTLCATILLQPGLAEVQVSHPGSPVDLTKCWSSLTSVQGCVTEIYKSVFTGKFDNVGPMCCKAASAVDAKCWPHMFPLNTFFPRPLKESCSRIINEAEPTPK